MSNEAKHTPAPWVSDGRRGNGWDTQWDIHHQSPHASGGIFCEVVPLHITAEAMATAEANVRLICAAPDLLAVCKSIVAKRATLMAPELWDEIRAAIAKAEGGAR